MILITNKSNIQFLLWFDMLAHQTIIINSYKNRLLVDYQTDVIHIIFCDSS
jgi:hypothetical protein